MTGNHRSFFFPIPFGIADRTGEYSRTVFSPHHAEAGNVVLVRPEPGEEAPTWGRLVSLVSAGQQEWTWEEVTPEEICQYIQDFLLENDPARPVLESLQPEIGVDSPVIL